MSIPQIQPKYNVAKGTVVTSDAITLLSIPPNTAVSFTGTVTLSGATFLKNGSTVGTTTTVSSGDTLAVTGTMPNAYSTPVFAPVLFANLAMTVFGAITVQDPTLALYTAATTDNPFSNFAGYTEVSPNNRLKATTLSTNGTVTTNITPTTGGPTNDGLPYLFLADYVDNKVHRISPATGLAVDYWTINHPYCVSYTPTASPANNTFANTLVSSPVDNAVYVYDGATHSLLATAHTGAGPYGVCGTSTPTAGDYGFWVACHDADRVEYWKYVNGTTLSRLFYFDLPAGTKPHQIAVDSGNNAWVTCLGTNQVAKVFYDSVTAPVYITVGTDPWAICMSNTNVYVANAGSDNVSIIDLITNAVVNQTVLQNPTHVVVTPSYLCVGSINNGTFGKYALTSPTVLGAYTASDTARLLVGMTKDSSSSIVYTSRFYEDAPSMLSVKDNAPDNVTYSSSVPAINTVTTTTSVTVAGIADGPATITIPNIYSSTLLKNGSVSAQTASLVNGNTLAFRFTSPSTKLNISIPILWEGGGFVYTANMLGGANPIVAGYIKGG